MDKKVNVKITANTSKFKKAVSDATKSLNNMKKAGDKLGKAKIDKNLNKQFNNITKSSKKVDKQLKQNTKSLNNINKTKLSNITKQFTNMDKTVKNNQKTLSSLQKVLNSLKAKSIESINKALTTMSKGASTVSKGFSNVKNVLSSISSKTIEALNKSITTLNNKCPTVAKGFNTIKSSISNISSKAFNTLSSALSNVKSKASTVGQGFSNLKSKISDASKASFQKLVDSITKVNTEGTKSGNVFTNIGNKIKSLTSGALGGLSSKIGLVVSSTGKMGSTFATTAAQVALVTTATKTLTGSTNKLNGSRKKLTDSERELTREESKMVASAKVSKDMIEIYKNTIKEAEQEIKKLSDSEKTNGVITKENAQKMQAFQEQINKLNDKIKAEEENIKKQSQALKNSTQATKENAKAEDTLKNSTEKANGSTRKLINGTQTLRSKTGDLRTELRMSADATKKVSDAQKKAEEETKSFSERIKDLSKSLNEGDFSGAFNGLKKAGKAAFASMPKHVKYGVGLIAVLKKLYDMGNKRFFEGLTNIKNTLQPVFNGIRTMANGMKTAFTELTGFQFRLSSIITVGANFENQMKKVSVIAKSVGDEEQQLIDKARELGASTRYSASQVGEAFEYMAMAGWSTDEMLKGVQSTLDLATIGATDLGTASDILTDDLTALGLQANQASDFADKLAATITSANTDVVGFGESMKQVGSLAGALGINMTDLATSIGLMANAGIKGSKAGMSLKNLLANMASPTKAQAKALKKLNVAYDEENGYVKTTIEGNIDLEATIKSLKKSLEGKTRAEKASAVATIAGKNALPGVMALLNATEEEYDELSDKINNSTSTVHMFNQNMHDVGVVGEDAQKRIEHMKEVFDETEISATALGLSSKELGYSISLLGNDSEVTKENVEQLLDVIESMTNATGDVDKFWRTVANAPTVLIDGKSINQMIDYNKTLQTIDDSTIGLSDHTIEYAKAHGEAINQTKEYVKNKIKECKTINEANQFLKNYNGLTAKAMSFKDLSYADKIDYLRQTFKGCTEEQIKNQLATIGLADSYDEVYEIVSMNNEEYEKYKNNLDIIEGAARRMAETMDEATVAAFYALSSAMEDSLIALFDKMKPSIMGATEALTDFFTTWRNGEDNNYTFEGFEKGIENLKNKVKESSKQIPQFITNAINGIKRFVTGGSLANILQIGTDIITGICQGIIKNKKNLTTAISEGIRQICDWIHKNKDQIKEAGLTILEAIGDGIKNNRSEINTTLDDLFDIINSWAEKKEQVFSELGGSIFVTMIKGGIKNLAKRGLGKLAGFLNGLLGESQDESKKTVGELSDDFDENGKPKKNKKGKKDKKVSSTNVAYAAEIDAAQKAGNKTADVYKKTVSKRLKDGEISKNAANEINKALDRGEQAKKGAWKTTKAYISELQSRLASGEIDSNTFDSLLGKLKMIDKAKGAADKASKAYYDSLEAGLMNGDIDPSSVDSILSSLEASDAIYKTASKDGKTYIDALRQQLVSGQITPEQFYALVFSGDLEEAAKKYAETGKITAGDVIDAKSFSNVQEVNDLMDALDDLNEKYSKLSGTITDSCKKMADSTRTNFVGIANIVRNQMVNVANIVRNQMVNCANIIKNQSKNSRDAATSQFISLKKVVSTQLSEARQIVTSKMLSISKVVNTQSTNARNNATRQFISLRKVIQTQMSQAYSSVSSYMSKIASATNRTLHTKVNVTKSVKTVDAGGASALATAFKSLNSMALSGSGLTYAAAGGYSGVGSNGGYNNSNNNNAMYFELPTYLDGKLVAKTTAKYMNNELTILDKKNSRKRGNI